MVEKKDKFLVAIDSTTEEDDDEPIEIPEILTKLMKKHGDLIGLKILILCKKSSETSKFFDKKVLEKWQHRIEFVKSRSVLVYKIGLAVGNGIHTIFYSSSQDNYWNWMADFQSELEEKQPNEAKNFGIIKIYKQSKLKDFSKEIIEDLENEHDEKLWPGKFELEQDKNFTDSLKEICEKLAKQMKSINSMELSKFANTWQNIISQHLTSSKFKTSNASIYKKYMLSCVFQTLLEENLVSNKVLEIISSNIFDSKEIIEWCNVDLNQETFQSVYNATLTNLEKLTWSDKSNQSDSTKYSSIASTADNSTEWSESNFYKEMSDLGVEKVSIKRVQEFIISKFLVKYEQANYSNIRKPAKFMNAISNFISQTFESKQFKKSFAIEETPEVKEKVNRNLLIVYRLWYFSSSLWRKNK